LLLFLVGLLRGLVGLLLLRILLLHGLLLLLLLGSLLLHGLLLLLLLRLLSRDGLLLRVVVIVATADQRQTCRSDAGPTRCSQERTSAHLLALHSLPIVVLTHRSHSFSAERGLPLIVVQVYPILGDRFQRAPRIREPIRRQDSAGSAEASGCRGALDRRRHAGRLRGR